MAFFYKKDYYIDYFNPASKPKRQKLVPFPRVGKRQALIPFPRTGKRSSTEFTQTRPFDLYLDELMRAAKQSDSFDTSELVSEPSQAIGTCRCNRTCC